VSTTFCMRRNGTGKVNYRSKAEAVKYARKTTIGIALYPYPCSLCGSWHLSHEKPNMVIEHVPSVSKLRRQIENSARIIAKQQKALDAVIAKQKAQQKERDIELRCIEMLFINQHQRLRAGNSFTN
jgi:hypothetical protein